MQNEEIIITKVKTTRGKKKASALERNDLPSEVPLLQEVGADSIGPSSPSVLPVSPPNPPLNSQPVVETKPRKKSAKTLAKEELIEAEKQMKKLQLEQETALRSRALAELQKLEDLKAQLLREEIQKQIEAEARGEVKRTRKTREASSATSEKKKTTRKIVKDLLPEQPAPPTPIPIPPPVAPSPAPVRTTPQPPGRPANPFSSRGGRTFI